MTSLRKRMIEDMRVRNLSVNTQGSYIQQVSRFARHFHKSPELLGAEQIRAYQVYLTNEKKLSTGSILIAIAALRFLYKVKDRGQSKSDIPGGQSHGHGDRDRSLRCRIRQIDLGEYRLGIAQSRHKTPYERWLADRIAAVSVLYIEDETTHHYAAGLELKNRGKPIPVNDLWIAALCRQHKLLVLSRDHHFDLGHSRRLCVLYPDGWVIARSSSQSDVAVVE